MHKNPKTKWLREIRNTALLLFFCMCAPTALAATSTSYQIDSDQVGPNQFRQTSDNYIIDGSIDGASGPTDGTEFHLEQGSPTRIEAEASSNSSSGSNGSGSGVDRTPQNFTVNQSCLLAYRNLTPLRGTKDTETSFVFVNNELSGVSFPTPTTWTKTVWLQPGENRLEVYAQNDYGRVTEKIIVILQKLRMGDINNDGKTDDYDLSLLTRKWQALNDCATDFNKDHITDDYDLSLLATTWSK